MNKLNYNYIENSSINDKTRRLPVETSDNALWFGTEAIDELLSMMQLCEPLYVEIVYTKKQSAECHTVLLYGGTYYTNV